MKLRTLTCLLALSLMGSQALGQSDDELRAKELIARISKEMARIDELLLQVDETSPERVKQSLSDVQENIDKLLKNVQAQQGEVIEGIEELVRLTKYTKSNQGQGDPSPDQQDGEGQDQKNRQRDRDAEPDDLKYQGDPAEREKPKPDNAEQNPQSGKEDQSEPEQNRDGKKPPPSDTEKFQREDVSGRWGNLPPKVAEMFMNLSPDQFPAKYRKLLEQYYKKANDQKK